MLVYFNSIWSTEQEQSQLHSLLPESHDYGDQRAILEDGTILVGKQNHDAYADSNLRIKTRKRCTIVQLEATHTGTFASRLPLEKPMKTLVCFCSVPDWHATELDVEMFLLKPAESNCIMPRIGQYNFYFCNYIMSMYEDLVMCLNALKKNSTQRLHLKMIPLAVGHTIKTRYGDYLGSQIIPAYLLALQYACNQCIDESWIETLEFVDHSHGSLSPNYVNKKIRIISSSSRDAFDFTGHRGHPAILAPCDAFSKIGGLANEKHLSSTLANNSNLRTILKDPIQFIAWP
jgi:hypothetical protein